jgi:hypothetical protein
MFERPMKLQGFPWRDAMTGPLLKYAEAAFQRRPGAIQSQVKRQNFAPPEYSFCYFVSFWS